MEDSLVNRLFSFAILANVTDRNEDVFFGLLPTILLLESIVIPSLIAGQRINKIMSGISIVTIYLRCFDWANCTGCIQQRETATGNATISLWQRPWMLQYRSECLSVVYVLSTETDIHLASCGRRMLGHLFGKL
jgi:hypothetical protein